MGMGGSVEYCGRDAKLRDKKLAKFKIVGLHFHFQLYVNCML